jgi:hypothetical protein
MGVDQKIAENSRTIMKDMRSPYSSSRQLVNIQQLWTTKVSQKRLKSLQNLKVSGQPGSFRTPSRFLRSTYDDFRESLYKFNTIRGHYGISGIWRQRVG